MKLLDELFEKLDKNDKKKINFWYKLLDNHLISRNLAYKGIENYLDSFKMRVVTSSFLCWSEKRPSEVWGPVSRTQPWPSQRIWKKLKFYFKKLESIFIISSQKSQSIFIPKIRTNIKLPISFFLKSSILKNYSNRSSRYILLWKSDKLHSRKIILIDVLSDRIFQISWMEGETGLASFQEFVFHTSVILNRQIAAVVLGTQDLESWNYFLFISSCVFSFSIFEKKPFPWRSGKTNILAYSIAMFPVRFSGSQKLRAILVWNFF